MLDRANPGDARESARMVISEFFDRYAAHDIVRMSELFSINADFSYVPIELWRQERLGYGKVRTVGTSLWTGMVSSFPNLSLTVRTLEANDDGDVVAQVDLQGTQERAWGHIAAAARSFTEPHLFVFHVAADGLIESITAYWNDAGISQQLGHVEVD